MFTPHNHCRACGFGKPTIPTLKISTAAGPSEEQQSLIKVLDLGLMPLANDFCEPSQERGGYAPLKLMWCPRCTLAQLSVVVKPEILYKNYPYVTSTSQLMRKHFDSLTSDLIKECVGKDRVIEIGSNDGTLLEYLMQAGFKDVLGIEPASNLVKLATNRNVPTWNTFFDTQTATELINRPSSDLIIMRHVFCHMDNWKQVVKNLEMICGKETVIAIEVPYLPDTLLNVEWDQIYHEHTSYLTFESVLRLLEGSKLYLHSVIHYSIHGGAVVLIIRRTDSSALPGGVPKEHVDKHSMEFFAYQARNQIQSFKETINHLAMSGKTVVGYGASAKGAQWIAACGFDRQQIKWVCDNTHQKQNKLMPGSNIPILDPGALTRELPDYAICFCWNYFSEVESNEKIFKAKGGKWIVPHGDIKIV